MVIGTTSHQLNGARFELQLASGFSANVDDEFYLMSGTGFVGKLTVWDGAQWNDLNHQDLLTAGAYEFQVNISGGDYKLITTVIPEPGVVGLLGMGFLGLVLHRRRRG